MIVEARVFKRGNFQAIRVPKKLRIKTIKQVNCYCTLIFPYLCDKTPKSQFLKMHYKSYFDIY